MSPTWLNQNVLAQNGAKSSRTYWEIIDMHDQQEKDDALLALSWSRIRELHREAENGADSDMHMLASKGGSHQMQER